MSFQGIDTAAPLTLKNIENIKSNGISFVGRYLIPTSYWNALTKQEIQNIHDAGLGILLCFEIGAKDILNPSKGITHGSMALKLAQEYGIPNGTVIFFACDFNAETKDYIYIESYLQNVQAIFKGQYQVGLYGHNRVIDYIGKHSSVKHFWQCVAWSNGVVSPLTDIYQYAWSGAKAAAELKEKIGVAVDLNRCENLETCGVWFPKKWYSDAMDFVKSKGIMTDGRPEDTLTRAEAATIIYRLLKDK